MNDVINHPDVKEIAQFTSWSRVEKAINSLLGIFEGISIDGRINDKEVRFINDWLREHDDVSTRHPFNELVPLLKESLGDGILTPDERSNIQWLCEKLKANDYTDLIRADLQRLHAILGGVASDGEVNQEEVRRLSGWLQDHEHLKRCWPYDEIDTLVTDALSDGYVDPEEQARLIACFSEFVHKLDDRTITNPAALVDNTIVGVCAVCPEIVFEGSTFCFTGLSARYSRKQFHELVWNLGGRGVTAISSKVDYLVIGADGNPCWAYACYGRKVEQAVNLRKSGSRIVLVHENDFHDAIAGR